MGAPRAWPRRRRFRKAGILQSRALPLGGAAAGTERRGREGVVQRRAGGGDALVSRQEVRAETGEGITHTRVALHCSTRPCTRPVAGGRGAAAVLMLKEHGGPRPRLHSHGCLVISRPTCPEARHTLQGCVFVQILPRTNGSRTQGPAAHLPRTVRERTTVRERAVSAFAVPKSSPMCYG